MEKKLLPLSEIEARLNLTFKDPELLFLSFVHRSFWNEHQESLAGHNERLEFLGDSVLGLIVAEYLYTHLPSVAEGVLSTMRARLVDATACISYINKLELKEFLLLGKGEKMNLGKGRDSIVADLFEALIGALYLDQGYVAARKFFLETFQAEIDATLGNPARNWKAELQDYTQKKYQEPPHYEVLEESGPPHLKTFVVAVKVKGEIWGRGEGSSKKEAQGKAAQDALEKL